MDITKEGLKLAIKESQTNKENNYHKGGPFGAVIIKNKQIIASSHNTVLENHDPTAHAEINVIRAAAKILKTHDLSDCILIVNCEPCPMCLAAIIWSNIKEIYFANTRKDASKIGFRDDDIYEYLKKTETKILNKHHISSKEALEVFEEFMKIENKEIY